MSRELLKRCRDTLQTLIECDDDPCQDLMRQVAEIDDYLAQPDEPVAWALFSKELMPTGAAYAIKRVEIQLAQIEADLGIQDAEIKPLYTSPPDQSARIAELERQLSEAGETLSEFIHKLGESKQQLAALTSDGIRHMETITELRNQLVTPNWENNRIAMQVGEIKELKQQLAALQAKLEGGVRVEVYRDRYGELRAHQMKTSAGSEATLLIDDGVEI